MTIPSSITTALSSLQSQVAAAEPLANASHATIVALQLNAANLISNIQTILTAPSNILDTWQAPVDPGPIVAGVLTLVSAAQDQSNLAVMRGAAGRAASNLDQLV